MEALGAEHPGDTVILSVRGKIAVLIYRGD